MFDPDSSLRRSHRWVVALVLLPALLLAGCGGRLISRTEAEPLIKQPIKELPKSLPFWLGNPRRNFYGTWPWQPGPLEIVWELETSLIKSKLHKDLWAGTSWPGQPSVVGNRVYFPSADGNVYCVNRNDGSIVWKYKAKDSFKATPTVIGDRIIASGLDHHIYCLNATDGTLIWDYETGFEVDCSSGTIDGRVYFGGEDGFFYCLNLVDGSLIYKTEWIGSMEGSFSTVEGSYLYRSV